MYKLANLALAVSLSIVGCSATKPTQTPIANTAPSTAAAGATAPVDPGPSVVFDHRSGLIKVDAVKLLAPGSVTYSSVSGYPGSGFHFGAFRDAASYDAFATAAGVAPFADIDWDAQMVVFAVLDAQTNQLSFLDWTTDDQGDASLRFDWIGIEPYYTDSTPAVLALVGKANVKTIHYLPKDSQSLGSYRLP
jgi:hypothetical protein